MYRFQCLPIKQNFYLSTKNLRERIKMKMSIVYKIIELEGFIHEI